VSTRAIIGEKDAIHVWTGRFHHWDGYPHGLGKALYRFYNGYFEKDMRAMKQVLLKDHPAGWSNIVGCDLSKEVGFRERQAAPPDLSPAERTRWEKEVSEAPQCYCHGSRHEPAHRCTPDAAWGAEWAYILDGHSMAIWEAMHGNRQHSTGFFGVNDNEAWLEVGVVDLDGPEPDWSQYE